MNGYINFQNSFTNILRTLRSTIYHNMSEIWQPRLSSFCIIVLCLTWTGSYMKLQARSYFSPIQISKCRKCFRHDHFINQCTTRQLCIRGDEHQSFENDCQNEIKYVNCQQHHCSGHSSCSVVQEKCNHAAKQEKVRRVPLLIHQQQSFDYNNIMLPPLFLQLTSHPPISSSNISVNAESGNSRQSYAFVEKSKTKSMHENVEQIIFAVSNSINSQSVNISAALTSQITDLAAKMDEHKHKTMNIEHQIQKSIIPVIQSLAKAIDDHLRHKSINLNQQTKQQITTSSSQENQSNNRI